MGVGDAGRLPFGFEERAEPLRVAHDALYVIDESAPHKIEVGIPMRDGIELAADIYLPAASMRPAPAIVNATPYNKDDAVMSEIEAFTDAGYVFVRVDSRGRGKSEGEWHPFTLYDAWDGHDAIEWVAVQDWCTGKVGASGLSYDGWTTIAAVSQNPPHLKAAIPVSPAGRWQEEIPYTFGSLQLFFGWWWAYVRRRINDSFKDAPRLLQLLPIEKIGEELNPAGPGWQEMMERDTLDDVWRGRRWDGAYNFDVPCLHVTGWHDREDIQGAFHHYEQMMECSPARENQWLLVGPWTHVSCLYPSDTFKGIEYPGASLDMTNIRLRFFDRFLKDEMNGVDDEPRVQIYDPGARSWQVRPAWKGDTKDFDLFLDGSGRLAAAAGEDGETSYQYDPMKPNGLEYDLDVLPLEPPMDLSDLEAQPGVISWTGDAFEEDLTVRGWGEFEFWAATDGNDTEWHVKVADVQPDGTPLWVAWGCLRASYGEDASAPAPVTPGEAQRYSVEMTPTFHTFKKGHSLRVLLASSEFPWFARNMNEFGPIAKQSDPRVATNTVFHGSAHPSRLRLRVE